MGIAEKLCVIKVAKLDSVTPVLSFPKNYHVKFVKGNPKHLTDVMQCNDDATKHLGNVTFDFEESNKNFPPCHY